MMNEIGSELAIETSSYWRNFVFEYDSEGVVGSGKWWSIVLELNTCHVRFGAFGVRGQARATTFRSSTQAFAYYSLTVIKKVLKGYIEIPSPHTRRYGGSWYSPRYIGRCQVCEGMGCPACNRLGYKFLLDKERREKAQREKSVSRIVEVVEPVSTRRRIMLDE